MTVVITGSQIDGNFLPEKHSLWVLQSTTSHKEENIKQIAWKIDCLTLRNVCRSGKRTHRHSCYVYSNNATNANALRKATVSLSCLCDYLNNVLGQIPGHFIGHERILFWKSKLWRLSGFNSTVLNIPDNNLKMSLFYVITDSN